MYLNDDSPCRSPYMFHTWLCDNHTDPTAGFCQWISGEIAHNQTKNAFKTIALLPDKQIIYGPSLIITRLVSGAQGTAYNQAHFIPPPIKSKEITLRLSALPSCLLIAHDTFMLCTVTLSHTMSKLSRVYEDVYGYRYSANFYGYLLVSPMMITIL